MKENFYQFCEEKANHYERSPKSSIEALQHCPGNFNVTLPGSRKAITFRTGRKRVVSRGINSLGLMQGSKPPKSGHWCAENSSKTGRQRSSQVGLKTGIRNFLQATRPFINGSIVTNADGSLRLFDHIADDYPGAILTGTESFMSPREHQLKNGQNQSLQDVALAIGRPTP